MTIRVYKDDVSEVEKAFIALKELWEKNQMSRKFIQVEFGQTITILNCLRHSTSSDEGVMEAAMEAIKALLHNNADNQINSENLVKQDIMSLLKKCITDFDISTKEPALHIVSTLLKVSSI